jgi:hypothetical protein
MNPGAGLKSCAVTFQVPAAPGVPASRHAGLVAWGGSACRDAVGVVIGA